MRRAYLPHPRDAGSLAQRTLVRLGGNLAGMDSEPVSSEDNQAVVYPIDHADLTLDHLPHPRDPFDDVVRFAYTFDGYAHFGMEMCGEMANRALNHYLEGQALPAWLVADMDRLRGCLYFEARRWIRKESDPDTRSLIYIHKLIDAIGDLLATPA